MDTIGGGIILDAHPKNVTAVSVPKLSRILKSAVKEKSKRRC